MATCDKKPYFSRKEAKVDLKKLQRVALAKKWTIVVTAVYQCEHCGLFHLTSMDKGLSRKFTQHLKRKKE